MKYTIGIDVGTSGTKTVLFDSLGKKQASHTVEYPLYQPKTVGQSRIPPTGRTPCLKLSALLWRRAE